MPRVPTHKVFVSFHHENDERYKLEFCRRMGSNIVDRSVENGDIDLKVKTDTARRRIRDDFIAEATVTVVLIGRCTWQRKHVDWEIGSSLRATRRNTRCGLLGILLPTHPDYGKRSYNPRLLPRRLADNCDGKHPFATVRDWPKPWNTKLVQRWIHQAFERRLERPYPINSLPQFARNRRGRWSVGWSR